MPNEIYRKRKVRKREYEWIDDTLRSGQKNRPNQAFVDPKCQV